MPGCGNEFGLDWQFRIYDWGISEYCWDRLAGIIYSYELSLSLYLTMCLVLELNSAWIDNISNLRRVVSEYCLDRLAGIINSYE